jgi:phosphomannomutase
MKKLTCFKAYDIRGQLGEELKLAADDVLMDAGVNVIDLGMTGTEEIYFA